MHAVDGVSLEVLPGRLTGLIGPNGAGKSTFLAVLAGTLPASSGAIIFDGDGITTLPTFNRARRGTVRPFPVPSGFTQPPVLATLPHDRPNTRGHTWAGGLPAAPTRGSDGEPQ